MSEPSLSRNEWVVLALLAERPTHGWALSTQLARGGEIGSIWSLSRPVVYHALERLAQIGLIRELALERGERGPHRLVYDLAPDGREQVRGWLGRPVEHVRDIRGLFLLKVVLTQRAETDVEPLLIAQRSILLPLVAVLEAQLDDASHDPPEATAIAFRLETAAAIVRFIDGILDRVATDVIV